MTNTIVKTGFLLTFNRVKKTVEALQNNKCGVSVFLSVMCSG